MQRDEKLWGRKRMFRDAGVGPSTGGAATTAWRCRCKYVASTEHPSIEKGWTGGGEASGGAACVCVVCVCVWSGEPQISQGAMSVRPARKKVAAPGLLDVPSLSGIR